MSASAFGRFPRGSDVSQQLVRVTLSDIQRPVGVELERVVDALRRIIAADFPIIAEVNEHLLRMKGKLFRPTLLLLSHQAAGGDDPRAVSLAAVVELIHLATLVHDDSVDHSTLRRGLPTINAQFSHQVAVIMGDYLYSRAIIELSRFEDLEPLRVFARVTNEMTVGEMRQLEAHDKLAFGEAQYDALIRAKTASLLSGACEVGALRAARGHREALGRFGMYLGMAFQITDDLLDYTQPQAVTGKPSGLDLKEHKVTLPLIASLARMSFGDRRLVERLMASPDPSDDLVADVIRAVELAEGLDYARRRAQEFAQRADTELETLPPSPARDALRDSIAYAVERHS
jgi:octaprenyl-diphosphate synthase